MKDVEWWHCRSVQILLFLKQNGVQKSHETLQVTNQSNTPPLLVESKRSKHVNQQREVLLPRWQRNTKSLLYHCHPSHTSGTHQSVQIKLKLANTMHAWMNDCNDYNKKETVTLCNESWLSNTCGHWINKRKFLSLIFFTIQKIVHQFVKASH